MIFPKISCKLTTILLATYFISTLALAEFATDGNDPHFYEFIRPRLGHLSRADGLLKIFEEYKTSVLDKTDKQLATVGINDWRQLRPTGELCVDFLTGFQVKDYVLSKPFEIIVLDACLDWLFDTSREKKLDLDRFNDISRAENDKLSKDPELKKLFNNTKFKDDKIPKELKEKIHEYFQKLLKIYSNNPRSGCNGLYLAAYQDFIEDDYLGDCEDDVNCEYFGKYAKYDEIKKDSYINLIIETTQQATKSCYGIVQKQMVEHMHQAYEDEPMQDSIKRKFKTINSKAAKQSAEMKWGREMMRILQLASNKGADDVIDLFEVTRNLKGVKDDDEDAKEMFTSAINNYAIKEIDTKDTGGDANGRARFGRAMTDLCRPYIDRQSFLVRTGGSHLWTEDPNSKSKPFEFFDMVYSLVRIANHMSFYKISKEKFENDVMKNGWEALYLATFACQLISTTWGELSYDTNRPEFSVTLRKNYHDLIDDWPIETMYEEYSKRTPVADASVSASPATTSDSSSTESKKSPKFKFGLNFNKKKPDQDSRSDSIKPEPEPVPEPEPEPEIDEPVTNAPVRRPIRRPKNRPQSNIVQRPLAQSLADIKSAPMNYEPEPPKDELSLDTLKMFKRLHGRLPKDIPESTRIKYAAEIRELDREEVTKPPTTPAPAKIESPVASKKKWQKIDPLSM